MNTMPPLLTVDNIRELSLNNLHTSGRCPLPEKTEQPVLLLAAGGGQRSYKR